MRSNLFKTSVLVALWSSSSHGMERFSPQACLEARYRSVISHSGPLFGLFTRELVVDKKDCVLKVSHRRWVTHDWVVDVCREPVHIKSTSMTGVTVAKKTAACGTPEAGETDFCKQYSALMDAIQDDGLIFAEGDRDSLASPHGKTYCAYVLMERYLKDSLMLSLYTPVPDIFQAPIVRPPKAAAVLAPAPVGPKSP
jgi:hypothetical protein